MKAAELFAQVADVPLPAAAVQFTQAGVPVFPCVPGGKRPLVEHGFRDASSDPAQVGAWWRRWPAANIGVPTGRASGFVVVDVDVHGPVDGRAGFVRATAAGLTGGCELLVRTPTGDVRVPFVRQLVPEVRQDAVVIDPPGGLFDGEEAPSAD